jgi:DNA polymerase delta subunit 2
MATSDGQAAATDGDMLSSKHSEDAAAPSPPTRSASDYRPLHTFDLPKGADRHYAQQFADMYFLRLSHLKDDVKAKAHDAWDDFEVRPRTQCALR